VIGSLGRGPIADVKKVVWERGLVLDEPVSLDREYFCSSTIRSSSPGAI
jgi:hypothetical protein